jgi:repressor LexA
MKQALTGKQQEVLEYIVELVRTRGYPPTLEELGKRFGIRSTNGVRAHLRALERKGYLKRRPRTSRGIELTIPLLPLASPAQVIEVPLVGRVAAGLPLLAVQNLDGTLLLDKSLIRWEGCFALKVKGDSMVEAGILDGDYVLVRPQASAENGDVVVALLDDEVTVKRFYREKQRIRLQPANSRMEPLFVKEARILGRVVALVRPKI